MGKLPLLSSQSLRMTPSLSIPRTLGWPILPSSPSDSVPLLRLRFDGRIACGVTIKATCLSRRIMELPSAGPCYSFWMAWHSAGGWACVKTAFLTAQALSRSLHFAKQQLNITDSSSRFAMFLNTYCISSLPLGVVFSETLLFFFHFVPVSVVYLHQILSFVVQPCC